MLRTALYTLENPGHSEWWRQSWNTEKGVNNFYLPKVKGSEDSKGLLSCRRKPQNELPYSQTESPNLLTLRAPCGIRLRLQALTSELPDSCPSLSWPSSSVFSLLGLPLWQSLAQILGLKYISSNTPLRDIFWKIKNVTLHPSFNLSCFTFLFICFKFYWSTVTFQRCISFFFTANWIQPHVYMYIYIPSHLVFFP